MKTMLQGLAIALFAATMGASGAAAADPSTPCTEANDGTTETVGVDTPSGTDYYTYQCEAGSGWTLIRRCSGSTGVCEDY